MRIWKTGDRITYKLLNELQRKADAYDKLLPEYKRLKAKADKESKEE